MTKPTPPRFAVDASDVLSVEVTEPTSGKKDTGWSEAEEPPHDVMNWFFAYVYLCLKWLTTRTINFLPQAIYGATNFALTVDGGDAPEVALRSSGSGAVSIDITSLLADGDHITTIVWRGKGNGTVDISMDVALIPLDGTAASNIGGVTQNNISNSNQALSACTVGDTINTSTHHVVLVITANAAGFAIYNIGINVTPPP
jgi:hypothetical protein